MAAWSSGFANRGEIAVRIIRACKEMGIATVAVYSEADRDALHVALADQSFCIGGPEAVDSYLNENQIISTALLSGAQAIHPGYGFLSENAHFAYRCRRNGLVFIGPDPDNMERLSDKAVLKELIRETCLTVIPGTKALSSIDEARVAAEQIGYPVMLKACAGGGGRGIRLIQRSSELEENWHQSTAEALSAFGDGSVYLEKYVYFDMNRNAYRRIRAICSRKYNGTGKCYVMLYNLDVQKSEPSEPLVRIRTFGYFDVFVGEQPIAFRNEKSKELFALLIDRRGGFVSSEEAIGFLWENEPASSLTMARYRKVALRLKNILEEYGVADIVESVNGKRRLIPELVKCDLYDYLIGKQEYAQLFKGSYLTNYSWGETTLAELTGDYLYAPEQ